MIIRLDNFYPMLYYRLLPGAGTMIVNATIPPPTALAKVAYKIQPQSFNKSIYLIPIRIYLL